MTLIERDVDTLHLEYHATRDPRIREQLARDYRPLVHHFASRYVHRGEPLDDLHQVAMLALLKALERFDPHRGIKFSTYAGRVMTGELKRHFRDHAWAMRVPRGLQELHLETKATVEELRGQLGRPPTVSEVAAHLHVSDEDVLEAMEVGHAYRLRSLDAPAGDEMPDLGSTLGDDDPALDAVDTELNQRQVLDELLEKLHEDDRTILRLYYLHSLSQAAIGEKLGMTQVAVSRRLARIRSRLHELATGEGITV